MQCMYMSVYVHVRMYIQYSVCTCTYVYTIQCMYMYVCIYNTVLHTENVARGGKLRVSKM